MSGDGSRVLPPAQMPVCTNEGIALGQRFETEREPLPGLTVDHMVIHYPSSAEEVLVCPGRAGANAKAKPGEPIVIIDGMCWTRAGLEQRIRDSVGRLRQAERELAEREGKH